MQEISEAYEPMRKGIGLLQRFWFVEEKENYNFAQQRFYLLLILIKKGNMVLFWQKIICVFQKLCEGDYILYKYIFQNFGFVLYFYFL